MDDLISRADAIQAVRHAWAKGLEPSQYIEIVPAMDAVPVVRCRDCRYCFSADSDPLTPYDGESAWYCDRFDFDVDVLALDPCRFYCADGERRDEDADN